MFNLRYAVSFISSSELSCSVVIFSPFFTAFSRSVIVFWDEWRAAFLVMRLFAFVRESRSHFVQLTVIGLCILFG